jgi:hypothetical protein
MKNMKLKKNFIIIVVDILRANFQNYATRDKAYTEIIQFLQEIKQKLYLLKDSLFLVRVKGSAEL